MKELPRGYYVVTNNDNFKSFSFKGITYSVKEGVNIFPSLKAASQCAENIPEAVIEGLDYISFNTPVILFSEGEHRVESFEFVKSLTLLGQNAGISPNDSTVKGAFPSLSVKRKTNETVLLGHYWFGVMNVRQNTVKHISLDGLSLRALRFNDHRSQGDYSYMTFKNIIHRGSCGRHAFYFAEIDKNSPLKRSVLFENCRVEDADAYDYGENFILGNIMSLTIMGMCCDNTCPRFGFTDLTRAFPNYSKYGHTTEIAVSDSFFNTIKEDGCISIGAINASDTAINVKIENSTFINSQSVDTPTIIGHLENEASSLLIKDCTFKNPSYKEMPAIVLYGNGSKCVIDSTLFEGYSPNPKRLPDAPKLAPDHIDTSMTVTATEDPHTLCDGDFDYVSSVYQGKQAFYGDLHVHTKCGGTSDGDFPMSEWPARMDEIGVDFVAVVDHRQMRGFFLPEWDDSRFIIGTEPAGTITDSNACIDAPNAKEFHYNMLFKNKNDLALVLDNFPEFEFKGDKLNGSFIYPSFTKARLSELVEFIHGIGGVFVHPHPKTMLASPDPLDYYFGEKTYLETLYESYGSNASFKNYELWVTLLNMGKRIFASGGSDTHGNPSNKVVSVFYSNKKSGDAFFDIMKSGDFTVGAIGMKMCIDGHKMGAAIEYKDSMVLTLILDDFYKNEFKDNTAYELRIYSDKGLCYRSVFNGKHEQRIALEVQKRKYYRAEVFDLTHGYRVAIGNPIWLK